MRAVVLTSTLYSDNSYMLNLFTDELGHVTTSVKVGKRSKVRLSHIQPLNLISVQIFGKPSQRIMHISECSAISGFDSMLFDPARAMMAQFLAEFLQHSLRSCQPDIKLFEFIFDSVNQFNSIQKGLSNFHLVFLIKLTHYLGFFPNLEGFDRGVCFDLVNGSFVRNLPLHNKYLSPDDTFSFAELLRMDYDTMYLFNLTRSQRNDILDYIIDYYKLHISDFGELRSLDILRAIGE